MSEIKTILSELDSIAKNPHRQLDKIIDGGKNVIGCVPVYCPEELVYAAGMIPFGIWGADGKELSKAKLYFPAFICSVVQSALELGLEGAFDRMKGVMIPVLCDSLKCMGQNFKAGVPQVEFLPVIHPQNRKIEAGQEFLRSQYQKLRKRLGEIGTPISDDMLSEAISVYNNHRRVMRKFVLTAAKYPDLISASARSAVIKSGFFMDKAEHTKLVEKLNALCQAEPVKPWSGKKVVTTGILADNASLLSILEKNSLAVVGDDVAAESRQFRTDVPVTQNPVEGLALQFAQMEGCSVLYDPDKKRADMIVTLAKEQGADGVIVLMTKFCDPEEFDYPFLKKAFDDAGIPSIIVEIDRQMVNYSQAATAIEAFGEML